MNYLIIGGSKSGKSDEGERIAKSLNKDKVIYIATMKPYDNEDKKRIEKHIDRRKDFNFITIEKNTDIHEVVDYIKEDDTVLIDSITSLLTNEMFHNGEIIINVYRKIINGIVKIMSKAENTIIISDYIFNDSISYDEVTENFRKELGSINVSLALKCDTVIECVFGNIRRYKEQ